MTKIGELRPYGQPTMAIYYDANAAINPYRVYLHWYEPGECGLRKCKKQIERYADLFSCVTTMLKYANDHNEESRPTHKKPL